ncbi:NAD(P)/FAD-dependent oxidoreductase [Aquimarina sp. ERC-38]|uniref:NAD(P)/FAD-dependent oxidoreductase n=1 Tax=Aquimarina sp. ERC-38 TaxID=2949996 RepID=UPI00224721A7|nr:NAD(P)/FAD-dependent oxidoreductase [Aquimarina sp. ERC-38]UZO81506.1 NAD(P)/FAD-dependent oxidoreductase [Aquimarina sp. ERC-38]
MKYDVIVIGGGAAGFFTAINIADQRPDVKILILERGNEVLSKVRISGGGRCNVTHAEFIPKELSLNYPRGQKELLGPFHSFMTGDTMAWFEERGVDLKIEDDGRIFPVSNSSTSIIDCFMAEVKRLGIEVQTKNAVQDFKKENGLWQVTTSKASFTSDKVVVTTGSNPKIWGKLKTLSHTIINAVPSLFTFNTKDNRIKDLPGLATEVQLKVQNSNLQSEGPLLITHWGFSGPAILKLSAWGALALQQMNYNFELAINWVVDKSAEEILEYVKSIRNSGKTAKIINSVNFGLPKRLWQQLVMASTITENEIWSEVSNKKLQELTRQLNCSTFQINGKSTFKEEFVTAGGVDLKEVNFKTFESKLQPGLYLAGEVLNIDAITGGFNFQNAWTGGFLIAKAIAKCHKN